MFNRIFGAERIATDFLLDISRWTTERKQLEAYVVARTDLAKIQIEARSNKLYVRAGISCKVLEVNGEAVSLEEQNLNTCDAEFVDNCPTAEEQYVEVVRKALAKFNICGDILSVSKEYAESYLRIIKIRKKMRGKERRGADVHI